MSERIVTVAGIRCTQWRPGPWIARSASDNTDDWPFWYVAGSDGRINGLRFPDTPGAIFTSRRFAEAIADALNKEFGA